MLDLNRLRVLVAIADHGGFTRAAEALHVAQPAISQQVKALEASVGLELVDRKTKRPTQAGAILVSHARAAMMELDSAALELEELDGLRRGTVRLGAIHWLEPLDLPALLRSFVDRYPGISIELHEENARVMFDMLETGDMDLVFSNLSPTDTVHSGLAQCELFTEDLVVAMVTGSHLGSQGTCTLGDLDGEGLIAFRKGSAFFETVDSALRIAGVTPNFVMGTSDLSMTRNLASRGLGIALLPRSLADIDGPPIDVVEIKPTPPIRTVALTWSESGPRSPASRAFLAFALEWLGEALGREIRR